MIRHLSPTPTPGPSIGEDDLALDMADDIDVALYIARCGFARVTAATK